MLLSIRKNYPMASPVSFIESNHVLVGTPEDRAAGTVIDLPIHRHQDLDGNQHVMSCWRLTPEELEEVKKTGKIWFQCWGTTHPPIYIGGKRPFK